MKRQKGAVFSSFSLLYCSPFCQSSSPSCELEGKWCEEEGSLNTIENISNHWKYLKFVKTSAWIAKIWEKTDRKGDWVQRLKRYCVYIIAVKNIIAVKPHEEHRHNLCSTSPSLWDNPPSSIYIASGPFSFKVYCLMFNGFRSRHLKVISDSTFQARCVVIRGDNPRTSSVQ